MLTDKTRNRATTVKAVARSVWKTIYHNIFPIIAGAGLIIFGCALVLWLCIEIIKEVTSWR